MYKVFGADETNYELLFNTAENETEANTNQNKANPFYAKIIKTIIVCCKKNEYFLPVKK